MKTFLEFIGESESEKCINGIVDRKILPQLDEADYVPFEEFLTERHILINHCYIPVSELQPMQNHINLDKVNTIRKQIKSYPDVRLWWQFFLSHDKRILDGHHRWAALKEENSAAKVHSAIVDTSFPELIALAHEYNKGKA